MRYQYDILQRRNCAKRFGVAATCGTVLVGLNPVVINAASADSVPGTKHNIKMELTNITARDANILKDLENKTDSTVLVAPKEPQVAGRPTLTVGGAGGKFGAGSTRVSTDQLEFTKDQN